MKTNSRIIFMVSVGFVAFAGGAILTSLGFVSLDRESEANSNVHSFVDKTKVPAPKPALKPFEFPAGGRAIFPRYQLVALYGTPGEPALGVLGQQSLEASINRVKELAADYQTYSKVTVYPAFEIIATVASASPTDNGDYSREVPISRLLPWVKAAKEAGVYVVLDLQPGRRDSLIQAKEYEQLLKYPNVGLALDPEWRLKSSEIPLKQIGSISIDEVNSVAAWLAELTSANKLPQKLFVLHQFQLGMLPRRDQLNTSYDQLAFVVQMDGQGQQTEKQATWKNIIKNPSKRLNYGWKNFYKKDPKMLSPRQTMLIKPTPSYISYQ